MSFELLKNTEIVVGLFLTVFTALLGFFAWWDKRSKKYVDQKVTPITGTNSRVLERITLVEKEVKRIDSNVSKLEEQVSSLPTMKDINLIAVGLAKVEATVTQSSGMLQSLYEAAMRAGSKK